MVLARALRLLTKLQDETTAARTVAAAVAVAEAAQNPPVTKTIKNDLDKVLRGQDPHDRIVFEMPLRFDVFGGGMTLDVLSRKAESVTAHLLPFYNIAMVSHLRMDLYDVATGRRPFRSGLGAGSYVSLEGCTVAAVPRNHWAFGVVLNDDLLDFVGGPRHRDLPQNKGAFSAVGGLNLTYPAYRGYDALSYSTEGYFEYIPGWLQDRAPLSDTYNPGQAPLFAYGPPRLTRLEQEAIVNRQNNFNELDKGVVDGRQLEREIEVYAFPQYRLIYKAELADGGVTIADASDEFDKRMWRLERFTPGSLARRSSYLRDARQDRNEASRWIRNNNIDNNGPPVRMTLLNDVKTDAFHNIILKSMLRNPVSKETWENPFLMTIKNFERPGTKDMVAVRDHVTINLMLGGDSPHPTGLRNGTRATLSERLQKKQAGAAATPPPPAPKSKAAKAKRSESDPARAEPKQGRTAASRVPPRIPLHLLQNRHNEAARQSLTRRVAGQVHRQQQWVSATEQRAKLAREEAKRKADVEPQRAAANGRPLPLERPVSDNQGYYKVLSITMTREFIDYTKEHEIDQRIKEQRNKMIRENHPDYSASAAEEDVRTDRAARINVAFDHLETCELRVKYHNAHRR